MHVAVVLVAGRESHSSDGAWKCFVDPDQKKAVKQALDAVNNWGRGGSKLYEVYVGTLTDRAVTPVNYKLVKLGA